MLPPNGEALAWHSDPRADLSFQIGQGLVSGKGQCEGVACRIIDQSGSCYVQFEVVLLCHDRLMPLELLKLGVLDVVGLYEENMALT